MHLLFSVVFKMSRNGKPVIEYNNYRFNLNKISGPSGQRRNWRCWRWRDGFCRATLLTDHYTLIKVGKPHNHPSLLASKFNFRDVAYSQPSTSSSADPLQTANNIVNLDNVSFVGN